MDDTNKMRTRSNFIKIQCECGNEQDIFSNASTKVTCIICEAVLAEPTGGKIKILGRVVNVWE